MRALRRLGGIHKILVVTAVLSCGLFFGNSCVCAAEVPDYRIQASPAKLELKLEPGKTVTDSFKIQNTGNKDFDFQMSVAPYSVVDEEYHQDFSSETNYTDITKWITLSETAGSIKADGEVEIEVTIKVPQDVPSGGQYAVILAKMIEPKENSNVTGVSTEKQVGVLVYSENVAGTTRKTGNISDLKISSFVFTPPIRATSVVENTGNVHVDASYILQVYSLFSDEEVYTTEENPEKRTILPETRRLNTLTWDGAPQLGIFKVKQTVKFLDEVKEIEKVVFICPIWFLLIILVLIFLAVFWIVSRTRGRKE